MEKSVKCPTREQVKQAARTGGSSVRRALIELFPEVFESPIQPGQIYEWGTDNDGGSGLVVKIHNHLAFINFHGGFCYFGDLLNTTTKSELASLMDAVNKRKPENFHHCYDGELRGPKRLSTWTTKSRQGE